MAATPRAALTGVAAMDPHFSISFSTPMKKTAIPPDLVTSWGGCVRDKSACGADCGNWPYWIKPHWRGQEAGQFSTQIDFFVHRDAGFQTKFPLSGPPADWKRFMKIRLPGAKSWPAEIQLNGNAGASTYRIDGVRVSPGQIIYPYGIENGKDHYGTAYEAWVPCCSPDDPNENKDGCHELPN